jgi:hypothetical protein
MSKNVAILNDSGIVIAINIYPDNYELGSNQILVTTPAYVGGDYVDGYFYPPKPYPSWTRNNGKWISPIEKPLLTQEQIDNRNYYNWNEQTLSWDIVEDTI